MIELIAPFVHPLAIVLLLAGAAAIDAWLIDRARHRPAPPPERP